MAFPKYNSHIARAEGNTGARHVLNVPELTKMLDFDDAVTHILDQFVQSRKPFRFQEEAQCFVLRNKLVGALHKFVYRRD